MRSILEKILVDLSFVVGLNKIRKIRFLIVFGVYRRVS